MKSEVVNGVEKSTVNPDNSQTFVPPDAMSNDKTPSVPDANVMPKTVGELLRIAREKAGLSPGEIASRLRMGIKQVRALEHDDYLALPKGTFLRGFVRNFSKEVGVVPEVALRLLAETHQDAASITASAVVMPSQQNISVPAPGGQLATPRARVLIGVVIATLVLAIAWYWWEYVRPHRADGGRPKVVAESKVVEMPVVAIAPTEIAPSPNVGTAQESPLTLPATSQPDTNVVATPPAPVVLTTSVALAPIEPREAVAAVASAPTKARQALPAGSGMLGFTFSGKSWVEVVDSTGKSVMDKTFKGGETEELVGRAPFSVVIGNAEVTRMAYNGKEIDLAPHTRASVARVTVK